MSRLLTNGLVALTAFALIASSSRDDRSEPQLSASAHPADTPTVNRRSPRCPQPQVRDLNARSIGQRQNRITLRVTAAVERGRIGSLYTTWGDRRCVVSDLRGSRRLSLGLDHTYRKSGTYAVSVIADSASALRSRPQSGSRLPSCSGSPRPASTGQAGAHSE
jgi:hypothetical protein